MRSILARAKALQCSAVRYDGRLPMVALIEPKLFNQCRLWNGSLVFLMTHRGVGICSDLISWPLIVVPRWRMSWQRASRRSVCPCLSSGHNLRISRASHQISKCTVGSKRYGDIKHGYKPQAHTCAGKSSSPGGQHHFRARLSKVHCTSD